MPAQILIKHLDTELFLKKKWFQLAKRTALLNPITLYQIPSQLKKLIAKYSKIRQIVHFFCKSLTIIVAQFFCWICSSFWKCHIRVYEPTDDISSIHIMPGKLKPAWSDNRLLKTKKDLNFCISLLGAACKFLEPWRGRNKKSPLRVCQDHSLQATTIYCKPLLHCNALTALYF